MRGALIGRGALFRLLLVVTSCLAAGCGVPEVDEDPEPPRDNPDEVDGGGGLDPTHPPGGPGAPGIELRDRIVCPDMSLPRVCFTDCDGSHCLDDGCGGRCACEPGTRCFNGRCVEPSPDLPPRVLFIGNSFTHMGPVPDCFRDLAVDAGFDRPEVHYATRGGATLAEHRANAEITLRYIDEGAWDVVILQDQSTRPTDDAGDPEGFKADATWLHDRVKAQSPEALVVLYQTWARHPDNEIYLRTFRSFHEMHSQLRFHYRDAAHRYIPAHSDLALPGDVIVAPVGDAWARHLQSEASHVPIYDSYGYHAAPYGQYLSALVIFKTVYRVRRTVGLTNRCGWHTGGNLQTSDVQHLQRLVDLMFQEQGE